MQEALIIEPSGLPGALYLFRTLKWRQIQTFFITLLNLACALQKQLMPTMMYICNITDIDLKHNKWIRVSLLSMLNVFTFSPTVFSTLKFSLNKLSSSLENLFINCLNLIRHKAVVMQEGRGK